MSARSIWLILLLVAVALRLPDVGNPLVDVDEQMYLLVGQRMLDGAIPYVDIWDRKPIGLFILYAIVGSLPGDPVIVGQLLALLAAALTAGVIATLASRFAGRVSALAAGSLYLVWLELLGGRGGQSPVFYNLLIVAAALLTWDTLTGRRRGAIPAMLLAGLALQIKPTVMFEGLFLGGALVTAAWHRQRRALPVIRDALAYASIALVPTAMAFAAYVAIGHADAWWFANVDSIFLRQITPADPLLERLAGVAVVLIVPAAVAVRGIVQQQPSARLFLGGWLATAAIGWLLVPPYFNHYALPLLVPIAIGAAGALDRRPMQILVAIAGIALLVMSGFPHWGETTDTRRRLATLAKTIEGARGQGCLFVFQAPPTLYTATRSCLPTRYPFPYHLVEPSEEHAIGVDPDVEVARILAAAPPVIAAGDRPDRRRRPTVLRVSRTLAQHYRPIASDLGITVYRRIN